MTEDQIATIERMWNEGWSIKMISRTTGYKEGTISKLAQSDRKRFPYRNAGGRSIAKLADMLKAGKITRSQMSRMLGRHK